MLYETRCVLSKTVLSAMPRNSIFKKVVQYFKNRPIFVKEYLGRVPFQRSGHKKAFNIPGSFKGFRQTHVYRDLMLKGLRKSLADYSSSKSYWKNT